MSKNLKYIFIGIGGLALIGLVGYLAFSEKSPGSLIAGLAALYAAIKSKVFNTKSLSEEIADVEQEHLTKRKEWETVKAEYDSKLRSFKARMDYLDYRSAKISEQIEDLDNEEIARLKQFESMSREEKLRLFENMINP